MHRSFHYFSIPNLSKIVILNEKLRLSRKIVSLRLLLKEIQMDCSDLSDLSCIIKTLKKML